MREKEANAESLNGVGEDVAFSEKVMKCMGTNHE